MVFSSQHLLNMRVLYQDAGDDDNDFAEDLEDWIVFKRGRAY
jgi:hypothetical protein